jgi:hypothetical protein
MTKGVCDTCGSSFGGVVEGFYFHGLNGVSSKFHLYFRYNMSGNRRHLKQYLKIWASPDTGLDPSASCNPTEGTWDQSGPSEASPLSTYKYREETPEDASSGSG